LVGGYKNRKGKRGREIITDAANEPLGEYLECFALYLELRMAQTCLIDVFRYDRFDLGEFRGVV
jgi:hypothetical protein